MRRIVMSENDRAALVEARRILCLAIASNPTPEKARAIVKAVITVDSLMEQYDMAEPAEGPCAATF